MVDRKYNIVSGTAYWASVAAPNTTFDSDGVWEVNVCNLDRRFGFCSCRWRVYIFGRRYPVPL